MNINLVKEEIKSHLSQKVLVSVYGMRNRMEKFEGRLYKVYPNLFSVLINGEEKSFPYRDIITEDIKIKYL